VQDDWTIIQMALNLIKLAVGVSELEDFNRWIAAWKAGRDTMDHVTRMFPRRGKEILQGGSLYWVVKGMVMVRQPIEDLQDVTGADGIERCRIVFKPEFIPVRPVPRRPFQGWRYLEAADAPPDLERRGGADDMPETLRRELAALGLL
jgi:hypothetical protein